MGFKLRLREVYAVDETNTMGTEWGSDEIYVGGAGLELRGNVDPWVHKIKPFKVASFEDRGRKTYSPPRELADFGLGSSVFPKGIVIVLFLAEHDGGDDIKKAYRELCEEYEGLAKDLKADMAADDGPASEMEQKMKLIRYAKKAWDTANFVYNQWKGDEMFKPEEMTTTIESEEYRWNGKKVSPEKELHYKGHGGHYILRYDWAAP
ncbi:hypothetical protein [Corynebacterium sp. A21]|uniref:hypothetical protein n=1 Tax=Corynebacterium sp. A21 TaxID=3457318 RepID=UPI003FD0D94B